jgi:tetratricopeptide (TPR) repeat protein
MTSVSPAIRRAVTLGAVVALGILSPAAGQGQVASGAADATAANSAFIAQDWPAAATAYERIAQAQPANGMAWLRLATSLLNLNQVQRAKPALERALTLQFNPMMVHIGLARIAAAEGNRDQAIQHLREGVAQGYATPRLLERDPNMAALKGNPAYDSLVARMHDTRFPCRKGADHRAFDFWIGTWDVFIGGTKVGTNRITPMADGCALLEDWNSPQQVGSSINYYDPQAKLWRQIFVYDNGGVNDWTGGMTGGKMVFTTTAPATGGTTTLSRMTFTPLGADSVTQVIETSADGGRTWITPWNSVYVRRP